MNSAHVRALVGAVLFLCAGSGMAKEGMPKPEEPAKLREAFFAEQTVHLLDLSVSEESLTALAASPQSYVPGELKDGDTVLAKVGVRLKGSTGSFRTLDQKPGFAIKFDEYVEGQSYRGCKKLL